jgi:hypothetical protein
MRFASIAAVATVAVVAAGLSRCCWWTSCLETPVTVVEYCEHLLGQSIGAAPLISFPNLVVRLVDQVAAKSAHSAVVL